MSALAITMNEQHLKFLASPISCLDKRQMKSRPTTYTLPTSNLSRVQTGVDHSLQLCRCQRIMDANAEKSISPFACTSCRISANQRSVSPSQSNGNLQPSPPPPLVLASRRARTFAEPCTRKRVRAAVVRQPAQHVPRGAPVLPRQPKTIKDVVSKYQRHRTRQKHGKHFESVRLDL